MMKKVAVLTSGGDAPGMNSVIHAICLRCANLNIEPVGVIGGFKGLYEGHFVKLHSDKTSQSASMGGTILKSSRFIEFKQAKYVEAAAQKAREAGIDGIIVIGGDGSYLGALALSKASAPSSAGVASSPLKPLIFTAVGIWLKSTATPGVTGAMSYRESSEPEGSWVFNSNASA